ncbi:DUF6907 domain-containing protein [Streptomyces polygonati]|uniref:DUF6907 domain-containing protein n=1 Tax=Streptomyces polygonati TaxID=1617087 RepID=A0ABV8HRA5_9ACTN
MTEPRLIEIDTRDHGIVVLPEPEWCTGVMHETFQPEPLRGWRRLRARLRRTPAVDYRPRRSEIVHQGPGIDITVDTGDGPQRLMELTLWQDPFPEPTWEQGTDVYINAYMLDDGSADYDVDGLQRLVTGLLEAAGQVRLVARQLADERRRGGR